jgi:hypothetical protein
MPTIILLLSFILVPSFAFAEDIYVAQNAAGLNNGSSCANARSAVWFNTAGNWATGVGKISGGDMAHLCGTITRSLAVQASGTAGNVIAIIFEPGAKLSQPVCPSSGCLNLNKRSYITVDGGTNGIVESTANGTASAFPNQSASIGVSAFPCSNCEIKNLIVQNIYVHLFNLADVAVNASMVNAIKLAGSNSTIHHNILHDAGWAIYQNYSNGDSNVEIHHNEIYNSVKGWTVAGVGAIAASNFKFFNNHIYNYSNWDTTSNAYHFAGVHAFGISGAVGDAYAIYNNHFEGACGDHMTSHVYMEGNAASKWTSSGTVLIFNNVFLCDSVVYGLVRVGSGHGELYNNVIIGGSPSIGICLVLNNTINAKVKNNALSGCNQLVSINEFTTFSNAANDLNYNTYACRGALNCFNWAGVSPFEASLVNWKAKCGCDGNSTDNDSLVLDSTGRPTAGSPVIGAGTNLTSLGNSNLNKDKMLIARPGSDAWTVGAYSFVSDPNIPGSPAAPANLTAQ